MWMVFLILAATVADLSLANLNVTPSNGTKLLLASNSCVILNMTISNQKEPIIISIDNNNAVSKVYIPSSVLVKLKPDNFSSYGNHNVTISGSNSFFWFPLFYEEMIGGLTVSPTQPTFSSNELINFTLTVNNGSNLLLNLFVDSLTAVKLISCSQNQRIFVVPYEFKSCEKINLQFRLSNGIYKKELQKNITVIPNVKDFNVTFSSLFIVPPDKLQINIKYSKCSLNQTNITATLIIDKQQESILSLSEMSHNISHILPLGKRNVTVVISNQLLPINTVSFTENVTVATNATLEPNKKKCLVGDKIYFAVNKTTIPMNLFQINISDGFNKYYHKNTSDVFLEFHKNNIYNMSWTISCPYFVKNGTLQLLVYGRLTKVTVKDASITIPDGLRIFKIIVESVGSVSGECKVSYGDGTDRILSNLDFPTNLTIEKNYTKENNYTFYVKCTGYLQSVNTTALTQITKINLNKFSLDYSKIIPLNTNANFSLSYNGNENPSPKFVTIEWDFGDGERSGQKALSNYTKYHIYKTFGNYSGFLTLAMVDQKRKIPFSIQAGFFSFSFENTTILVHTVFKGFLKLASPMFPTDPQITYKITFNSKLHTEISSNKVHLTSQPIPINFQINRIGVYIVTFEINGDSFQENFNFDEQVLVENLITDLKLGAPEKLTSDESLKVNISAGLKTQDLINITCKFKLSNGQNKIELGNITNTSVIEVTFKNLQSGQMTIDVHCFNELSFEKLFKNVTVVSCLQSNALFMKRNQNPLDPIQLQNSQDQKIKSNVRIKKKCEAFKISYQWKFLNNIGTGASFTIKKNEKPGLHRIDLSVTIDNITQSDHVYINLTLPNLEAIIQGGSVIMRDKKQFTVDAASLSYDPNQGQGKTTGLSYSWLCRVIDKQSNIFDPNFNTSNVDFSRTSSETGCDKFQIKGGTFMIYSSMVKEKNWYIFQVQVSKDNRTATARQAIFITPQKVIPLQIGCVLNCLPKLATTDDAIFKAEFPTTSYTTLSKASYKWELFLMQPIKTNVLSFPRDNSGPNVKLSAGSLEEDVSYQLRLTVGNLTGYADNTAVFNLKTNRAPVNGKCTINPMNGKIDSMFYINCFNWQDPDGIWKYIVVFKVKDKQLILSETIDAVSSEYRLPAGDEEDGYRANLIIQIYDIFKAYSQVDYTIQVKPDEKAQENLLNNFSFNEKMQNDPEFLNQNAGNIISILNTIKVPVNKDSVANMEQMSEKQINNIFSQDATKVNEKWNSIIDSLSDKKDKKLLKIEKMMNDMSAFISEGIISEPPTNEIEMQQKAQLLISVFENPKVSQLNSVDKVMTATTKLGEILFDLSKKKPIDLKLNQTTQDVAKLVGTIFDQIIPEEPLSSEPMTLNKMRKKIEQTYPNPDSAISIEERAFLALKSYQREKLHKKDQKNISGLVMPSLMKVINKVSNAMSSLAVLDGSPAVCNTDTLKIGQWTINNNSSEKHFQLPGGQSIQTDDIQGTDISMVVFKKNPYMYESGSENLKDVISLSSEKIKKHNHSSGTVKVSFAHEDIKWDLIQPTKNISQMIFYRFHYRSKSEKACVKMKSPDKTIGYIVYMRIHEYPTIKQFNYQTAVEPRNLTDGVYTICFPDNAILETGYIYVGLQIMKHNRNKRSINNGTQTRNITYQFGSLVAGCSILDKKKHKWNSDNCKPKYNKEKNVIECECNNPVSTIFSNSFYVPPNSIDFSTVFSKFDLINNGAVFGVVIAFICIYLILLIVTRYYDREDFIRWSIIPLVDNVDTDLFWYIISVYTGLQYGSGTKSRISFKVAGEIVDTKIHSLTEGHQKEFKTGSVLKFLMSTTESLGNMQYLHIWHDNSGSGDSASWYLNKIEITDLQTSQSYVFLCNSWLAVEEGDGSISRVLPVSTGNELLSFNNKFFEHTRQKITDEHIWLSIVFRPLESPFNRKKRLSTAFALLFLTMISNAMFYSKPAQVVQIGPIRFSPSMIWTSFMGIIISTLPIIFIMTLFKKSKNKSNQTCKTSPSGELLEDSFIPIEEVEAIKKISGNSFEEPDELATWPWFCAYIAWFLVVLSILASSFFVILYSQEWGKEKSEEWLTAFFLSFFESCFIVDPLKVIVISIILSFFSKNLKKITIAKKKIGKITNHRETLPSSWNPPLSQKILKQARAMRRSDLRMREVIQDLFLYVVFLWVIYHLSFDNRDPHAFEQSQQLGKLFHVTKEFKQVQIDRQLFTWINSTFFPNFFPQTNYKGTTLRPLRKLFISDQTNFRMGPARFRLLRMKSETCKIPYIGTMKCFDNYNMLTEDTDGYCIKWKSPPCGFDEEVTHLTFPAWNFTSATKIWGFPFMGTYNLYGGGGYILNLEINLPISIKMLNEITQNLWIDRTSRALFIEFTLYNANVNLFTYVVLLAEIPNIGEILPYTFFYSFKALADENSGMIFVYQLLFLVFILMMLIRSCLRMFHLKWTFFGEIWYVLDFLSSLSCGATVGMYIMRNLMIKQAQESLKADPKKFINFYHIVIWDQFFVALMAILVFLCTIRFLRILGYNKRISAISMVITSAKKDMSGFFILFIIIFWTFTSFGYLLFGKSLKNYKSIWSSMTAMFVGMLGKTNFSNLRQTRHSFGPLFYLGFVFIFIFFLLRMVESILNDSIQKVNAQMFGKEESMSLYLYNKMPEYIRKILFPGRENILKKTDSEFCDVRIISETKDSVSKKVATDATADLKNLNLSSFDMMYHLINKDFDDSLKEIYAENDRKM